MKVSRPALVAFLFLAAIPFQTGRLMASTANVPPGACPYALNPKIANSDPVPASAAYALLSTTQGMGAKAPAALNMKVFCLNIRVAEHGSTLARALIGTTVLSRRQL
jgi:hypothetical protein